MQFEHICNCPKCNKRVKFEVVPMQTSKLIKCAKCNQVFAVQVIERRTVYRTYMVSDGNVAEPFRDTIQTPKQGVMPWQIKQLKSEDIKEKEKSFNLCNTCSFNKCIHKSKNYIGPCITQCDDYQ